MPHECYGSSQSKVGLRNITSIILQRQRPKNWTSYDFRRHHCIPYTGIVSSSLQLVWDNAGCSDERSPAAAGAERISTRNTPISRAKWSMTQACIERQSMTLSTTSSQKPPPVGASSYNFPRMQNQVTLKPQPQPVGSEIEKSERFGYTFASQAKPLISSQIKPGSLEAPAKDWEGKTESFRNI